MIHFAKTLIDWYLIHKRDLPWRNTKDPYIIYLSEIILQQTRVAQGLPYFIRFVRQYPTVQSLALAEEEDVLRLWQGLGYYSRARNMHQTAQNVVANYQGVFPTQSKELLQLKGVGSYTAAAIASFSNQEQIAVVDGNVTRVLARFFGIEADLSQSNTLKIFQEKATELLPKKKSDVFNQAIMEFGALQCVPKSPDCISCIFRDECVAFQLQKVSVLPIKTKKIKVTKKYLNYLILEDGKQHTQIIKREGAGIWQNLYEFPCIELASSQIPDTFKEQIIELVQDSNFVIEAIDEEITHKLSHQTLYIRYWRVRIEVIKDAISISKLAQLPFPIVHVNFMKKFWDTSY